MARSGNRFVSYLGTEIEPKAISTLSQFERATEKAFQRIEAFNNKGAGRIGLGGLGIDRNAASGLRGTTTALAATRAEAARVAPAMARVSAETNRASVGFTRASQSLSIVQGQLGPLAGRLGSLGTVFRDLAGISLAGVLGGAGAFALAGVATSYQKVTDRLRPFYDTQQQTNDAMSDVIKIARDTRQALDPVAQLYSRLSQAGKDANLSFDVSKVSTTVAKAARLSGGDADTQANGITQFLQGVGSGTLGGDELKSIRENTFRLAKAIADGLGVPIAKLKELGAAGKLTPQVVTEALARSAAQIDLEFSRLPKRIGSSLTEAGNNLAVFIGRLDESSHATEGFAEAISAIGNNIPTVLIGLSGLAAVFAARSLAGPIDAATASLARFGATQLAVARGSATAITPRIQAAGKASVVANRTRDEALTTAYDLRSEARKQALIVANLDARIAKETEAAAVQMAGQRANVEQAQQGVILAQARVSAAEQELVVANQVATVRHQGEIDAARARVVALGAEQQSLASARAAAQQRLIAAQQAGVAAAGNTSLSRSARNRAVDTSARQQAIAEAELTAAMDAQAVGARNLAAAQATLTGLRGPARTATQAQIVATEGLAAAEAELAAATGTAAAATTLGGSAANNAAKSGIGLLAIQEQRILSNVALAASTEAANAATLATIPAVEAATVAQRTLAAAQTFGKRAGDLLSSGASKLSALLGGPVGIALTAATVGFTYLATRTEDAKEAGNRFVQAQAALQASLGGTTAALATQTAAARELTIALAEAGVEKAKQAKRKVGEDLAASLTSASENIDLRTAQGRADFSRIRQVSSNLSNGVDSGITFKDLNAIRNRNKDAFGNSSYRSALGSNPADTVIKAAGFIQSNTELRDSQKAVATARAAANAPPLKPIDLSGGGKGSGRTVEQLKAEANDIAEGGTALAQARATFNKTQADLDAELAKRHKNKDTSFDDEYVKRLAAAKSALNAVGDGQRAAAAGTRAHNKAIAEQNRELEKARGRAEKLSGIRSRYDEAPTAVDSGNKAKDQIDGFFTSIKNGRVVLSDTVKILNQETGKIEFYSREDAERDKANIDAGVRKPITEAIQAQRDELDVSRLILGGREDEADLLRQKQDLVKSVGNITAQELRALKANNAEQKAINDAIEKRNAQIDIQVRAYGNVRDAVRDVVAAPSVSTVKSVVARLKDQFKADFADKFVLDILGDPEKEARDEMTRGLNDSAKNLSGSATSLDDAATELKNVGVALQALAPQAPAASAASSPLVATAVTAAAAIIPKLSVDISKDLSNDTITQGGKPVVNDDDNIVVVGRVLKEALGGRTRNLNLSTEERYNDAGLKAATKLFGSGSILTKGFSKLGTLLSGAGIGSAANSVLGLGGKSQGASLGAGIGGALGKSLLGGKDGLLSKGLTAISSKLGSFAGPLGAVAGSVVGSVLGGLFKTNKQASSTVSVNAAGVSSTTGVGKGSAERAAATGLGGSTSAGLQKIAEALGGSFGSSAVSIGYRPGHKDPAYRVDTSGQGKLTGVQAFETQEEAIQYAIIESLKQGAIKGIREGTKRLLAAGNDLDAALNKALRFEQVFKDLKAYTDPVGAAIDSLNTEFESLINLFNEAGATASEFADLQKLYDFKRADAIKSATEAATSDIQDFIDGLKNSTDSPLSRRTVYTNAKAKVDTFRSDIAGGKAVDSDALLEALKNYQDTSAALNGSRSEFYNDFDDILALATKAQANLTTPATPGSSGTLPASPFDPAVAGNIASTAANTAGLVPAINDMTKQLGVILQRTGLSDTGSTLNYLPSVISR
jgi:tape measure domain-containing protein